MGSLLFFAFSWWSILLRVVAIIHFIRRRPDTYWLWIILIHWMGALVYIFVEVIPDAGLMRQSFKVFPRRRRIHELESAILDNPSAGNYEELADLYLEEASLLGHASAMTKQSRRAPTRPIPSIVALLRRSTWATSPRPCRISNA